MPGMGFVRRVAKAIQAGIAVRMPQEELRCKVLSMRLPGLAPVFSEDEIHYGAVALVEILGPDLVSIHLAPRVVRHVVAALGGVVPAAGPWIIRKTSRPIDVPIQNENHGGGWIKLGTGDELAVLRGGQSGVVDVADAPGV